MFGWVLTPTPTRQGGVSRSCSRLGSFRREKWREECVWCTHGGWEQYFCSRVDGLVPAAFRRILFTCPRCLFFVKNQSNLPPGQGHVVGFGWGWEKECCVAFSTLYKSLVWRFPNLNLATMVNSTYANRTKVTKVITKPCQHQIKLLQAPLASYKRHHLVHLKCRWSPPKTLRPSWTPLGL